MSENNKSSENKVEFNIGAKRNGGGFGQNRFGPVQKPKNLKKTMLRLWSFFGSQKKFFIIVFILVIINSCISLAAPFYIGKAVDVLTVGEGDVNYNKLIMIACSLLIVYIVSITIEMTQGLAMASISQRIIKNFRKILFNKLQSLPVFYFDITSNGELMSRLTNDVDNISVTISSATIQLMSSTIIVSGSLVMMLSLSPLLTFASLITVPMVFLLTKMISKRTKILFKEQQVVLGKLNGHIEESISGISIIKGFNHEQQIIDEFEELNDNYKKVALKAQIWSGYLMPIMNVINNFGFAAVAAVGGFLALKDIITVGIIASFLTYSRQFSRPLNEIASIYNTLQSATAGAERVFELIDEKEEIKDLENSINLEDVKGDVCFENVSFSYKENEKVLKNISFNIKAGTTVALVGETGSGKTTIVNLISRFYDVNSGKILIDGIEIKSYKRDSLRKIFSIVLQDTYLFSGTIKDNIRYGKLDASEEEIILACKMSNAHNFIKRLKDGYNTKIKDGGNTLSAGQKQLIAIARAILANTRILILDEATSNVDTRTELKIQEAMLKLMEGKTSFIIAHRLSTIKDCDIIMVLENGQILETGNHDSLMNLKGKYYNLYSIK